MGAANFTRFANGWEKSLVKLLTTYYDNSKETVSTIELSSPL